MDELIKALSEFKERLESIRASLHIVAKEQRLEELRGEMLIEGFWQDQVRAQKVSRETAELEKLISFWNGLLKRCADAMQLATLDKADTSVTLRSELEEELNALEKELASKELEVLLGEPYDAAPAILTVYGGAGGVDAQDWAEMLSRMYLRFAARSGWTATVLHKTVGQEAGIKNVTIRMEGAYAYGYLKAEAGVHRLVRISPFDADQSRHTSFAMIEVLPELDQPTTI